MGQEAQRVGRAVIRVGTLVLDFKNRTGRLLQQGGQRHTTPRNIWCRGETFAELEKRVCVCVCVCVGKIEPVRWRETGKTMCEEKILRLD